MDRKVGVEVEHAVFDREELLERVGGDEALCHELMNLFLADAPNSIKALQQALADKDLEKMQREAHALKGAAAYVSARSIRRLATTLELAAREGQHSEVVSLVKSIEQEIGHLES